MTTQRDRLADIVADVMGYPDERHDASCGCVTVADALLARGVRVVDAGQVRTTEKVTLAEAVAHFREFYPDTMAGVEAEARADLARRIEERVAAMQLNSWDYGDEDHDGNYQFSPGEFRDAIVAIVREEADR